MGSVLSSLSHLAFSHSSTSRQMPVFIDWWINQISCKRNDTFAQKNGVPWALDVRPSLSTIQNPLQIQKYQDYAASSIFLSSALNPIRLRRRSIPNLVIDTDGLLVVLHLGGVLGHLQLALVGGGGGLLASEVVGGLLVVFDALVQVHQLGLVHLSKQTRSGAGVNPTEATDGRDRFDGCSTSA